MGAYNSGRGVPQGASVYLVGHSLGGMVAQNLAASGDFTARWTVRRVVTLGSPRTVDLPTGIVRRFAAIGDPIPQLSPAAWDLGGFNLSNQIWVDNAVPPNEAGNPIAPHLHYPDSRDLGSYDALGERTNVQQVRNIFVLDPASQEYCPSQVL
jgi:pimeloyl-ACP methyl ester carboxylesterase